MTDEYDTGMGTDDDMWEILSDILHENEVRLPKSLNEAIYALRVGKAMVVNKNNEPTELLASYSAERGTSITVANLIESHRALVDELNRSSRQEWKDAMQRAYEHTVQMTMDSTWIKIEKLRGMSVQELVNMVGEDDDA